MKVMSAIGRAIKRFFLWLFMVAVMVVLLVGGVTLFFYQQAGSDDLPQTTVSFGGTALSLNGFDFTIPILGGITHKEYSQPEDLTVQDLGSFTTQPAFSFSEALRSDCTTSLTITNEAGETVFSGSLAQYESFQFVKNGKYQAALRIGWPPLNSNTTGESFYQFRFVLDLESEISISANSVYQGDVIAVSVKGLPQGATVTVDTELGTAYPVTRFDSIMAYIPVAYNRADGDYTITVTAGGFTQQFTVKVLYNQFQKVSLAADTLAGSNAAVQAYQQVVFPLYQTHSDEVMWSGVFQHPVEQPNDAVVLSDYGSFEYIADRTSPSRNIGITYKCHSAKQVVAPAGGTVVYAGTQELTNGLVVIEHGAGIKSYIYHMSSVNVKTGDVVQAGTPIGTTSELLQFDMRIGNQAINPNLAINGANGMFWRAP